MFRSIIKIAYRNIVRRRVYSTINILGLGCGIASFLLILMFVTYESSYENFYEDHDRIYRVALDRYYPDRGVSMAVSPTLLGPAIQEELPQVEAATRIHKLRQVSEVSATVTKTNGIFNEPNFLFSDEHFFDVFHAEFIHGDAQSGTKDISTVVITQSVAQKYFGKDDVLGEVISIFDIPLQVGAVIKDQPRNSHFHFDLLASIEQLWFVEKAIREDNWTSLLMYTYIKLKQGTDPLQVESALTELLDRRGHASIAKRYGADYAEQGHRYHFFLQPLDEIHLRSQLNNELEINGNINLIYILSAIGLIIIVSSVVNFVNLSIALSAERAKEVGLRKVMGSLRSQLIRQFLMECSVITFLSALLALGMTALLIPTLNFNLGTDLNFEQILNSGFGFSFLGFFVLLSLLAGFYPALVLSAMNSSEVIKGNFKSSKRGIFLRNALIVGQFTISIMMIIGSFVVNDQLHFLLNKDLGFDKYNVLVVRQSRRLGDNYDAFRNQLLQQPWVKDVGGSSYLPGEYHGASVYQTKTPEKQEVRFNTQYADSHFLDVLKMEIVDGRGFDPSFSDSLNVVINETAAKAIGGKVVGMHLINEGPNMPFKEVSIIGVVKDYHFASLHEEVRPIMLFKDGPLSKIPVTTYVRLGNFQISEVLSQVGSIWESLSDTPFKYTFLDTHLAAQYEQDQVTTTLFNAFTLIAILMAGIGLFGLATYLVHQKSKEMSVRKVLGASTRDITKSFSLAFLKMVVLSFCIGGPTAYFVLSNWLNEFAYRIELSWAIFLLSALVTITLVFISMGYQAIKINRVNPVVILKNDG